MRRLGSGLVAAAICAALIPIGACKTSDQIPPKGATVTVAATPTTIPLADGPECISKLGVQPCGEAQVFATVNNEIGVPLPDQDVRFTTTAGKLFTGDINNNPVFNLNQPIRTDKFGNAEVNLITSTTATVTARSGTANGTLTINTAQGNLSQITLNVDTTTCPMSSQDVISCTQQVCLVATALDTMNNGVPGVVILFKIANTTGSNTFAAVFNPAQPTTQATGEAMTTLTPGSNCPDAMTGCTGNKCTGADVIAFTQAGLQSPPLHLTISIP